MEAIGPACMADEEALFREDSTASRLAAGIRNCAANFGFAVVRWTHPRGLPTASETLEVSGGIGRQSPETHSEPSPTKCDRDIASTRLNCKLSAIWLANGTEPECNLRSFRPQHRASWTCRTPKSLQDDQNNFSARRTLVSQIYLVAAGQSHDCKL